MQNLMEYLIANQKIDMEYQIPLKPRRAPKHSVYKSIKALQLT